MDHCPLPSQSACNFFCIKIQLQHFKQLFRLHQVSKNPFSVLPEKPLDSEAKTRALGVPDFVYRLFTQIPHTFEIFSEVQWAWWPQKNRLRINFLKFYIAINHLGPFPDIPTKNQPNPSTGLCGHSTVTDITNPKSLCTIPTGNTHMRSGKKKPITLRKASLWN